MGTDNMIDYILYGGCETEECPPGLVRSDDILTFNKCVCPYKWQQQIQTASIPPQLMCTCDDEKYEINEETGMCECKKSVAEYEIFGLDGSCDCPRHMRYNAENDACEEINTGTVIDIDENCWYYDFELEACLSKDEFDDQFDVKPTENPFDQNEDPCPGFEVGWKGLKSTKINYKSPTGYLIHVNVLNNQANVDVTVEDYIGFLIFSKRYCGVQFIKELDNGNVKIDFFDKTCFVKEINLDIAVVEFFDELDTTISLTEDEEANVVLNCDIDVCLVVEDVDVDEVTSWGLVVDLGTLKSLPANFEARARVFILVERILCGFDIKLIIKFIFAQASFKLKVVVPAVFVDIDHSSCVDLFACIILCIVSHVSRAIAASIESENFVFSD